MRTSVCIQKNKDKPTYPNLLGTSDFFVISNLYRADLSSVVKEYPEKVIFINKNLSKMDILYHRNYKKLSLDIISTR